jgi:hypothetical protein
MPNIRRVRADDATVGQDALYLDSATYLIVHNSDITTLLARGPYRSLSSEEIALCLSAIDDIAVETAPRT